MLSLQLALELVEEAPVGRLRNELVWRRLDHAGVAQPQRVEANRVLGIILAPFVVGDFFERLQRIVVASGEPAVDHSLRRGHRISDAKVGCLENRAQRPLGCDGMLANERQRVGAFIFSASNDTCRPARERRTRTIARGSVKTRGDDRRTANKRDELASSRGLTQPRALRTNYKVRAVHRSKSGPLMTALGS